MKQIIPTEHYGLINNINIPNLSNLVYKIKSSNDLDGKEEAMTTFAKKVDFILEKNSDYRKKEYLRNIFKEDFLNKLQRECNGYFRHAINDSGDREKTNEWANKTIDEKKKIIDETLTYYLMILAILRDNDDIDEFIQSFNNNVS